MQDEISWENKMASPRMAKLIQDTKAQLQARFPGCRFLAILGSINYQFSVMPNAESMLAQELGNQLSNARNLVLLTGGNPITGIAVGNHTKLPVVHLCPSEFAMPTPERGEVWNDIGDVMEERQIILAACADIAISFGGGPGTRNELELASIGGRKVVPLPFTGGVSFGANLANLNLASDTQRAAWKRFAKLDGQALERLAMEKGSQVWRMKQGKVVKDIMRVVL